MSVGQKQIRTRAVSAIRDLRSQGLSPATMCDEDIMRIRNVGRKTLADIRHLMQSEGAHKCPCCGCLLEVSVRPHP